MPGASLKKSALLMLVLSVVFLIGWEYYWRSSGYVLGYDDDEGLWYKYRRMVYEPEATVFIGSSRMKFDLDISTWDAVTGEKAVQLALNGSNPRAALVNLSNDEKFKGRLVVDVTEGLFFGTWEDESLKERLKYLKEATPSQKVTAHVDWALESQFVFLDKSLFSLNAMLARLPAVNRKGVEGDFYFPTKFTTNSFRRQQIMTDEFVKDTAMQRTVQNIWAGDGGPVKNHGVTGDTLQRIFEEVKTAVAKIKMRGGKVIFNRTPSSGAYWAKEPIQFPRAEYFNQLALITGSGSIHFNDYADTKDFICPEWSHLTPADAKTYTRALVGHLREQHWFDADKYKGE
jgi:hypothetical protein